MQRALIAIATVGMAALTAAAVLRLRAPHPAVRAPDRPRCPSGATTPGIDVSYHQDEIDWRRVARAGIKFAFIRLSDGTTVRDPRFATNWLEARRAGLLRGAYQFFRPEQSVTAQADLMIAAMKNRSADDLPPVLDIEDTAGLPPATVAARARVWLDRVRDALDVEPIVYTGVDLWRGGGAELLAPQRLWLAHYTQGCPIVPSPWPRWTFWQHTERGAVPGIDGAVDLNLFAGDLRDLRALD